MGTWGVGPFENDGAADLAAGLMSNIVKLDDYGTARAAAQFLILSHGTDILGGPGLSPVIEALAKMRSDIKWLAGWKQPKKIAAELEGELHEAFERLQWCKGCRRALGKKKVGELKALVEAAECAPIPKHQKTRWVKKGRRRVARKPRAAVK